jgi:bifunctional non-homologous end joining protein LigD
VSFVDNGLRFVEDLNLSLIEIFHPDSFLIIRESVALPGIEFSDHVEEQGKALFEIATKKGLEGIVGKDADSPYLSGSRTDFWLKFKNYRIESFHIGGFTRNLNQIESLLFGMFKGKEFIHVGR